MDVEGAVDQGERQHDVGGGGVHETVCPCESVAGVTFHHELVLSVEVGITVEREILAGGAEGEVRPHTVSPMFVHDVERLHVGINALNGFRERDVKHVVDAFAVHEESHLEPRVVDGATVEVEFGVRESYDHFSRGNVGAVSVPALVHGVASDGVAVVVLRAGDVAASGVGEGVDADAREGVARVEGARVAVETVFVCFRVDTVHAQCFGAHVRVFDFVGRFEGATDVGFAHADVARFVGTYSGDPGADPLVARILLGAHVRVVAGGAVDVLYEHVLGAGVASSCDGITAADSRLAHVVGGALGPVVAGGVGERDRFARLVGAHLFVAGDGGALGGVCAAVGDRFESA